MNRKKKKRKTEPKSSPVEGIENLTNYNVGNKPSRGTTLAAQIAAVNGSCFVANLAKTTADTATAHSTATVTATTTKAMATTTTEREKSQNRNRNRKTRAE